MKEYISWLESQCNRCANGSCRTRSCLKRGGYISGAPDYNKATCIPYEILQIIKGKINLIKNRNNLEKDYSPTPNNREWFE